MAVVWRRLSAAPGRAGLWARIRGSKVGLWTQSLVNDYREACKELVVGTRDNPGKAAVYCMLLAGASACTYSNPSDRSFQVALLESANQLLVLSPWVRSEQADQHVQKLLTIKTQGRLRHQSLLLFSFVYADPHDPVTSIYDAQCEYLKPRWSDFPDRVLDFGFLGKWWVLGSKMKDWDINDIEFAHLPAEQRTITPRNLHSAENERLYDLKFQPVILQEEDTREGVD